MTKQEIIDVIKKNIAENLDDVELDTIDPQKTMKDYGANSLDIIEVVSCSMRELNIKIPRTELADIKNFSLADFFYNDNPDVLSPPADFETWFQDPLVQGSFRFFEQQLLQAPKTASRIYSGVDGKKRDIINLTSYNYLGLSSHPEVIQAAKEALDVYGLGASGATGCSQQPASSTKVVHGLSPEQNRS